MTYNQLRNERNKLGTMFIEKAKEVWPKIKFDDCKTFRNVEDVLYENHKQCSKKLVEKILNDIKHSYEGFDYKFEDEKYWLDGSEYIYIEYLKLYRYNLEIYSFATDELYQYHGLCLLMKVILYWWNCSSTIRQLNRLIQYNAFEK